MREPSYDPLDIKTFGDLNALAITLTVCAEPALFIYKTWCVCSDHRRETFFAAG